MPRPPVNRAKRNRPNQATKRPFATPTSKSPAAQRRRLDEQLAHKKVGRTPNDSDDSDQLVVKARSLRNRRGIPRQEVFGSGAVAQGDQVAAHMSPLQSGLPLSPKRASRVITQHINGQSPALPPKSCLRPIDLLSATKPSESSSTVPIRNGVSSLDMLSSNPPRTNRLGTPAGETSILGPVKIRKRQPSILQILDSPGSSLLDHDLDDFLPFDESTPLPASRKRKLSPAPAIYVAEAPADSSPQANRLSNGLEITTSAEPDLPPVLPTTMSRKRQPLGEIDVDTMAPPKSSSSAPSPTRTNTTTPPPPPSALTRKANLRRAKDRLPLSTTALQSLMPMQRQRRTQLSRAAKMSNALEVPEDSSGVQDSESDVVSEDSYNAAPRSVRTDKKQTLGTTQKRNPVSRRQPERAGRGSRSDGAIRRKGTSTQSPPTFTSQDVSTAKTSSLQQRNQHGSGQATTPYSKQGEKGNDGIDDSSGEEDDKENRPSGSFGRSFKQAPSKRGKPTSGRATMHDKDNDNNNQAELRRGRSKATSHGAVDHLGDEQARLVEKFKEVDEWEMEFETLDADSGSDLLF